MSTVIRWAMAAIMAVHALIHLLGAVKGFGWAQVPQLSQAVGPAAGLLWLLAAILVLASAAFIAAGSPSWWWSVALGAAVISEMAIVTSWADAKAGTVVNVVLALAAAYGFISAGPSSFLTQWRDQAAGALRATDSSPALVTEADLASLPELVASYVRNSGAVGKPRVTSFLATFHGRIRSGPGQAWMPFTAKQVSTYGPRPQRVFLMAATRSGLPVTVLHQFADSTATMRAKALHLLTVVNSAGPEMDRGETVTVFNDLVVLAPGALVDAPVQWSSIDAQHVRGVFTNGLQTVSALLTFNAGHDLVDFVSDDRLRASSDGRSFTVQRWSTPISGYRGEAGRRVMTVGEGRWDAPPPEGPFTYVELHLDGIAYNVSSVEGTPRSSTTLSDTAPLQAETPAGLRQ